MKNTFCCLVYFLIYKYISCERLSTINSVTAQIIVQQNKLLYVTNDVDGANDIHIYDLSNSVENSVSTSDIARNKMIFSLNEEKFILFGYEGSTYSFCFQIYNHTNEIEQKNCKNIINQNSQINIILLNEKTFLLYFISGQYLYLYYLGVENQSYGSYTKQISMDNLNLNTIECDSLDDDDILCIYSLIDVENKIQFYYSFGQITGDQFPRYEINTLYKNIFAASINKFIINNERKFIMCFINRTPTTDKPTYQLFCQSLLKNYNGQLYIEKTTLIENSLEYNLFESNYINNIPIKIVVYKYTIYILVEMTDNFSYKKVIFFGCSLDFGLCINYYHDLLFSNSFSSIKILINSFLNIIFCERNARITNIFYIDLPVNYTDFEKQFISPYGNIDITSDIKSDPANEKYIAFSLDGNTLIKINDQQQSEGLTARTKFEGNIAISLQYSINSPLTNNYYVFFDIFELNGYSYYKLLSHFSYFKVINCQENCSACHHDIVGTSEKHQCSSCISGYNKYNNGKNEDGFYNCYKEGDPNIPKNTYLDNKEGEFKYCHESCNECYGSNNNCKSCKEGFFFRVEENDNNIIRYNTCYSEAPKRYYLNFTSNISHNGGIVRFVYKPCFYTCETCFGDGNPINNNCIDCRDGYTKYPFNDRKCTENKDLCTSNNFYYWRIDYNTKNIECISNCNGFVIKNATNNYNQCVDNCNNFLDPFQGNLRLISFECGGEKVCITFEDCNSRGLKNDNNKCYPDGDNCHFIPRTTIPESTAIPPSQPPIDPLEPIEERVRFIKNFEMENYYSQIKNNFENIQLEFYEKEFGKELSLGNYTKGIDFITFTKYKDFSIIIYPLETEQYVKEDLIDLKSLCYVNFTKYFQNYKMEEEKSYILIALIEHKNDNLPINTINYFFMLFNEITQKGEIIKDLSDLNTIVDVSYPLFNYEHENISAKYSTELITTIKELNDIDENFNFFDQGNSFYNDICYSNTFQEDIDITIRDRIKEYYIEISFCENGCSFIKIYDKDKNPKALCECELKEELNIEDPNYSFNTTTKEKESVSNFKALTCFNEVFSSELSSNPSFWIFLVMIFIHIALFIGIIFCAKSAIEKMLKSKKENIISIENNNANLNNENNINNNTNTNNNIYSNTNINNNNNNNIVKIDKSEEEELKMDKNKSIKVSKASKEPRYIKNSVNSVEDNESKEFKKSKKESSESNPPKKGPIRKNRETTGNNINNNKQNSKNENETSLFESEINYNFDKDSGFEDIFDDIGQPTSKVNNYIQNEKDIKKDNYIYLGKKLLFGKLKQSLTPLDKKVFNKYKYINTVNEINDTKMARNINITGMDSIKKEHYSMDDIKIKPKNLNLINYSDIKNKGQKLSKFSKLFGEESILSGNDKFLQSANILGNKNGDKYEKDLKENNNKNNSSDVSNISEKKESEGNYIIYLIKYFKKYYE